MKLLTVNGRLVGKSVQDRLIQWDKPSLSKAQFQVKQFFKPFWLAHVVYEEFPVYGTRLRVDILNATNKVAIEVHGPQHERFHHFHNNSRELYLQGFKNDSIKTEWLEKNHFSQIIIYTDEIEKLSKEFVLQKFSIQL